MDSGPRELEKPTQLGKILEKYQEAKALYELVKTEGESNSSPIANNIFKGIHIPNGPIKIGIYHAIPANIKVSIHYRKENPDPHDSHIKNADEASSLNPESHMDIGIVKSDGTVILERVLFDIKNPLLTVKNQGDLFPKEWIWEKVIDVIKKYALPDTGNLAGIFIDSTSGDLIQRSQIQDIVDDINNHISNLVPDSLIPPVQVLDAGNTTAKIRAQIERSKETSKPRQS